MARKILDFVFTALYFLIFYGLINYASGYLPVNFVWDLACIVCIVIAFVLSVWLADKTVNKIIENL